VVCYTNVVSSWAAVCRLPRCRPAVLCWSMMGMRADIERCECSFAKMVSQMCKGRGRRCSNSRADAGKRNSCCLHGFKRLPGAAKVASARKQYNECNTAHAWAAGVHVTCRVRRARAQSRLCALKARNVARTTTVAPVANARSNTPGWHGGLGGWAGRCRSRLRRRDPVRQWHALSGCARG
jgi:hypothetical protein